MKKGLLSLLLMMAGMAVYAVPAKQEWQTRTQSDGSTIEVMQLGDEFCHVLINRDGRQVRENANGMYEVVGDAPTPAQIRARRAQARARRAPQSVGTEPNLAPKGVVILANFKDSEMKAAHTQATFDELCNSTHCTVNNGFPSAAQYFADQSNGAYRPVFDVFGPVNLSRNTSYYGTDIKDRDAGDDEHAADAVVEACRLANQQFTINWADYDSDNDGYVDFVYLIYAGKGQADGGAETTIWPHNWSIAAARELYINGDEYGRGGTIHYCTYTQSQCILGGKEINMYACSSELSGSSLCGIGTLCHEFGHVMGLPDLYDTEYGDNYTNFLTPTKWSIMDQGCYNGSGHCPCNYDPWSKAFFGWTESRNLGLAGRVLTLKANGVEGGKSYQINFTGEHQKATDPGWCYYLENRQQQGWDTHLPGHGLLVWKVNYSEDAWSGNAPNNTGTVASPLFSIRSASGTKIGTNADGPYNTFPGEANVTSITLIEDQPITDITETDGVISLVFIHPYTSYEVKWVVNGEVIESREYNVEGVDLELPDTPFEVCEGTHFIGWTKHTEWCDPFNNPGDLFKKASGQVIGPVTYYAVFE